jgi:hypothetical protein
MLGAAVLLYALFWLLGNVIGWLPGFRYDGIWGWAQLSLLLFSIVTLLVIFGTSRKGSVPASLTLYSVIALMILSVGFQQSTAGDDGEMTSDDVADEAVVPLTADALDERCQVQVNSTVTRPFFYVREDGKEHRLAIGFPLPKGDANALVQTEFGRDAPDGRVCVDPALAAHHNVAFGDVVATDDLPTAVDEWASEFWSNKQLWDRKVGLIADQFAVAGGPEYSCISDIPGDRDGLITVLAMDPNAEGDFPESVQFQWEYGRLVRELGADGCLGLWGFPETDGRADLGPRYLIARTSWWILPEGVFPSVREVSTDDLGLGQEESEETAEVEESSTDSTEQAAEEPAETPDSTQPPAEEETAPAPDPTQPQSDTGDTTGNTQPSGGEEPTSGDDEGTDDGTSGNPGDGGSCQDGDGCSGTDPGDGGAGGDDGCTTDCDGPGGGDDECEEGCGTTTTSSTSTTSTTSTTTTTSTTSTTAPPTTTTTKPVTTTSSTSTTSTTQATTTTTQGTTTTTCPPGYTSIPGGCKPPEPSTTAPPGCQFPPCGDASAPLEMMAFFPFLGIATGGVVLAFRGTSRTTRRDEEVIGLSWANHRKGKEE